MDRDDVIANDDRPLLTQCDGDCEDVSSQDDVVVNNNNDTAATSASGPIFDEEDEGNLTADGIQARFDEDGFNLLTQSNSLFAKNHSASDDSEHGYSSKESDDDSSGSTSSSSESSEGESLQQRRLNNIRRNEERAKAIKLEINAMLGKHDARQNNNRLKRKAKEELLDPTKSTSPDRAAEATTLHQNDNKRRGMIFATKFNGMIRNNEEVYQQSLYTTTTLAQELNGNYPHRSRQIHYLCSRLQSIVSRTKMAWNMSENERSFGESYYSEASYSGRVKMSVPAPILISGPGGSGKTSIVCDAIQSLRERANHDYGGEGLPMCHVVASAYVDCASAESTSVVSVMNNAFKQLAECFHSKGSVTGHRKSYHNRDHRKSRTELQPSIETDEKRVKIDSGCDAAETNPDLSSQMSQSMIRVSEIDNNDDDDDDGDSEGCEDDDFDEEDLIEKQRKRRVGRRRSKQNKRQSLAGDKSTRRHTRQTRLSTIRQHSQPAAQKNSGALNNSLQGSTRNANESSSIAIFGRAISSLLQGDVSKKRAPRHGRCAFLILDNADRILSWNKSRRNNPLADLLLLPKIMGINLTLILISRSSLYQYSRVQMPPGTILDAVQPNLIHFDSYSKIDIIKDIMLVPRIRHMVTGRPNLTNQKHACEVTSAVREKFEQICYSSLLSWFIASVKGSTHDLTEIIRLARFLWPEYMSPIDGSAGNINPVLESAMWQILFYLRRDVVENSVQCNCSSCVCLSSEADVSQISVDLAVLKQQLFEKLDQNILETMRGFLSNVVLMPGRVLNKHSSKPYAERLPYVTKFLLLAAFLCQNKKAESDKNLFTKKSTGMSRRSANETDLGSSYASSSAELKQLTARQASFPIERLLSVFYSIMSSYGQSSMHQNREGTNVSVMGTELLFRNISQLDATGLIRRVGSSSTNASKNKHLTDMTSAKFTCTVSREDARVIAETVGFPLDRYCS